ncbi:MAG: CBS domain-containing protein [Myxococcales bacterium]|nr:CBS domain-containing protein [Myxococcales bacterium]
MKVADIMTPDVVTVHYNQRVNEALAALYENDIRQVPVVDFNGVIVGILTDRDIKEHVGFRLAPGIDPEERRDALVDRIDSVMSTDPMTVQPEMELSELIDLLLETKVGGFPVVDDDKRVLGIVTYIDVLRELRDRADV